MAKTIDVTSPQLDVVKKMFEAYRTRKLDNAKPVLSKNYTFKTFPKIADLSEETKGEHLENYGPKLASLAEFEQTFHEVIEAPGKVVVHWISSHTHSDGSTFEYDSLSIITLVEEDGELEVLELKDFADPEKGSCFHEATAKGGQIA